MTATAARPARGSRSIAVCLDDFGLHPGVNRAALQLAEAGRLTAISCNVAGPAWREGAGQLADAGRHLDVGLHLDLTECPVDARARWSLPALLLQAGTHRLDRALVHAEINAQLDRFEQALGRMPAHVDGHQHVHQLPIVRDELIAVLLHRYRDRRPWLRRTRRPAGLRGAKPWLIERLGGQPLSELAARHGFAQNEHLLGVYDFQGDAAGYGRRLAQWVALAVHGDLLMCHAGQPGRGDDPIARARSNEWQVLAAPAFADLLAQAGVRLAPLSALAVSQQ